MQLERAKKLVCALADGIDPMTGQTLPEDSVYNRPEIIRALHCVLQELDRRADFTPTANAGKSWTKEEEDRLLKEYEEGTDMERIAARHGRSRGAIEMRLAELAKRDQLQMVMR